MPLDVALVLGLPLFGVAYRLLTGYWTWKISTKKDRRRFAPFGWGVIAGLMPVIGSLIMPHRSEDSARPYARITGNYIYGGAPWTVAAATVFISAREGELLVACIAISLGGYAACLAWAYFSQKWPEHAGLHRRVFAEPEIAEARELAQAVDDGVLACRVIELDNRGKGCRLLRLSIAHGQNDILDFDVTKNSFGFLVHCVLKDGSTVARVFSEQLSTALNDAARRAEQQGALPM